MSFFNDMNSKMQNFMVGRNGSDRLGRWCLGAAIAFLIVNMIAPNAICSMLSMALLFYCIYRMFSTNVAARSVENEKFEGLLDRLPFAKGAPSGNQRANGYGGSGSSSSRERSSAAGARASASTKRASASKMTFPCEECGQSLSVPKGRGKLKVTCPKCHHQMSIDS